VHIHDYCCGLRYLALKHIPKVDILKNVCTSNNQYIQYNFYRILYNQLKIENKFKTMC